MRRRWGVETSPAAVASAGSLLTHLGMGGERVQTRGGADAHAAVARVDRLTMRGSPRRPITVAGSCWRRFMFG